MARSPVYQMVNMLTDKTPWPYNTVYENLLIHATWCIRTHKRTEKPMTSTSWLDYLLGWWYMSFSWTLGHCLFNCHGLIYLLPCDVIGIRESFCYYICSDTLSRNIWKILKTAYTKQECFNTSVIFQHEAAAVNLLWNNWHRIWR